MEELYPAQLDGFDLEIETLDDTFEKAIVEHEIPNKDGALLEDMGQKARQVNMRCYFWDHGDHLTYAKHRQLINHLDSQAMSELVHPQYGRMEGMVKRITARHDDREMMAEVDISFVENLRGILEELQYEDVESGTEEAFNQGQEDQAAELAGDLAGNDLELDEDLAPDVSILAQLKSSTAAARVMAKELDAYITLANSVASGIAAQQSSLVSAINYGVNLPGRIVGTLARMVERTARTYDALSSSPARFIKSLKLASQDLENQFASSSSSKMKQAGTCRTIIIKHLRIACAQRIALEAAYAYNLDERKRQQVRRSEQTRSFDVNGRYVGNTVETVLNVRELDESLADARELLQAAVDEARGMRVLQTMAATLLDHVNIVKLERDRIVSITLDRPTPLHLVCLMYGLPYQMADRLASINDIPNPNFTNGTIDIYVR